MNTELIPADDALRVEVVRRYDILDTPPDGAFDRITALAAKIFDVPICIVSIVDHDRIWFKSHHGIDVDQIDREPGLCASAILQDEPWVVTDAKVDPRTLTNPLVCGELGLRFYVGIPLKTADGYNLGTLNIIDREARTVTEDEITMLRDLAAMVVDELELRLSARRLVESVRERRRHGMEINDDVVQHLAVAKMALDLGHSEKAQDALSAALSSATAIVTELISEDDGVSVGPGDLVRHYPAGQSQARERGPR